MEQQSDIQYQIQKVLNEISDLSKVEYHLVKIEEDIQSSYLKRKQAKVKLDKELKDVNDLENIGIKSLFYKTLGSKEKQIEKERQEYLNAALHYKQLNEGIELLEFEKNILSKKAIKIEDLETKLEALKIQREKEILDSNSPMTIELKSIANKIDQNLIKGRAVNEAISEGDKSLKLLGIVINFLRKAKEWGRWDMYSKNRSAGYMKHQAIDKAVRNLTKTQHQLNKFSRELSDLGNKYYTFDLNIGQFNKFMDFFFDNLISDWIIQQRIKTSLNNIEKTYSQVQRIIIELKNKKDQVQNNAKILSESKDRLLLTYTD